MDTATFRDIVQVVPAIALAAAGQVAATTLGQCARLLDEHGSAATLLTRHAARNAAYYTGDLSHHVANRAQLYAARAAYQAQRQAHRVTSLTDTLADVLEASVQTAAASAQRAAHRQADRAAAFADDQAAAANIAMQSLVGRLPGGVQHNTSSNSSGGFAADEFDPWANIPPRHSNSSSDRSAQAACNAASPAAAAPGGTDSGTSSSPAAPPVSMFPQDVAQVHGAGFSTPAAATQELQDQLLATEAALENTVAALDDAHAQLAVRQLTADIFRAVERRATNEQLQELSRALLQSRAELHAARLQLEAAADTVAALPQQMVLMVQNQMRRAMREGMVELMREALASPEPATPAAAAAVEGAPVMGYSYSTGGAADLAGLAAAAAAPSAVAHTPRSPASPAANINSPAASADAAAAMEDDQACTEADQAAALLQLEQELLAGVSVAPAAAGRGVGAAAVAAAGGSGSSSAGSVADDDGRSSDGEAFVMVEAGAEEV